MLCPTDKKETFFLLAYFHILFFSMPARDVLACLPAAPPWAVRFVLEFSVGFDSNVTASHGERRNLSVAISSYSCLGALLVITVGTRNWGKRNAGFTRNKE